MATLETSTPLFRTTRRRGLYVLAAALATFVASAAVYALSIPRYYFEAGILLVLRTFRPDIDYRLRILADSAPRSSWVRSNRGPALWRSWRMTWDAMKQRSFTGCTLERARPRDALIA